MDLGKALQEARLRAGLTREQVSQNTKIKVAKIEALEANAFDQLPKGIYLAGFVRAYAREVGLDPEELVRPLRGRSVPVAPLNSVEQPVESVAQSASVDPQDYVGQWHLGERDFVEPPVEHKRQAVPVMPPALLADTPVIPPQRGTLSSVFLPAAVISTAFVAAGAGALLYETISPYQPRETYRTARAVNTTETASPVTRPETAGAVGTTGHHAPPPIAPPTYVPRTAASPEPRTAPAPPVAAPPAPSTVAPPTAAPVPRTVATPQVAAPTVAPPTAAPAAPRTVAPPTVASPVARTVAPEAPRTVAAAPRNAAPPAPRTVEPAPRTAVAPRTVAPRTAVAPSTPRTVAEAPRTVAPPAVAPRTAVVPRTSAPRTAVAPSTPRTIAQAPRTVAPRTIAPSTVPPSTVPPSAAESESRELSGAWALSTEIESSSVNSFEGLRLGYRVRLEQNGNQVRGAGRKVSENGRPIAATGQTPIDVHGKIEGDRVMLTFTEQGTARQSSGIFELVREGDALYGRFSSTAARSRGSVDARRQ